MSPSRRSRRFLSISLLLLLLFSSLGIPSGAGAGSADIADCDANRTGTGYRATGDVLINELLYDTTGDELSGEFIELFNSGPSSVDITCWTLSDQDGTEPYDCIFPSMVLPSGAYAVVYSCWGKNDLDLSDNVAHLYIDSPVAIWTNTGDDALLVNATGAGVDYVAFGNGTYIDGPKAGLSWTGPNGTAPEGSTLARLPNGIDTDAGSDWTARTPTPGYFNEYVPPDKVVINEFMPQPASDWNMDGTNDTDDEWIELHNGNESFPANISGFTLDDAAGGTAPYTVPRGTFIPAGGYIVFFGNATGIGLNDPGDTVRLFDVFGNALENFTYGVASPDIPFGRMPDGTGNFSALNIPTPGSSNRVDGPPVIVSTAREPVAPDRYDTVNISANISDDVGVRNASLRYSFDGSKYECATMSLSAGTNLSGNYAASIPPRAPGTNVSYYVEATDTRGQTGRILPPESYVVRSAPPRRMNISGAPANSTYRPGAGARISGNVTYDTGEPVQGASVIVEYWGGGPIGTVTTNATGRFSVSFSAPIGPANYSINLSATTENLTAKQMVILTVVAEPNDPPAISEVQRNPLNPTSYDDVLVCATAKDDHGLRAVRLCFRTQGQADFTKSLMNASGYPGRFISRIPRQVSGTVVSYYVEAWDGDLTAFEPSGAPQATFNYTVTEGTAQGARYLRLSASLNCTECFVGSSFMASGSVTDESGGGVSSSNLSIAFVQLPGFAVATGLSDSNGIFRLNAKAPNAPGGYNITLTCSIISPSFGLLTNSTNLTLNVKDTLRITLRLSRVSGEPGTAVRVTGRILRADGTPAAGAIIKAMFQNDTRYWAAEADESGMFNVTLKAPGRIGRGAIAVNGTFAGSDTFSEAQFDIQSPPKKGPGFEIMMMAAACIVAAVLAGRLRQIT